jgi:hypothetical protein
MADLHRWVYLAKLDRLSPSKSSPTLLAVAMTKELKHATSYKLLFFSLEPVLHFLKK